jgi:hypothetical protein
LQSFEQTGADAMQRSLATAQELVLECPFESAINRHADWVQQRTTTWAQQYGLLRNPRDVQQFHRWQYGILMARAYPLASRDALALIADWNTWLFLLDDQFDEGTLGHDPAAVEQLCSDIIDILRGHRGPYRRDHPSFRAVEDIADRLADLADSATIERLVSCLTASFRASIWEASNREAKRVPSKADYHYYRPFAGAVYCYLTLMDLALAQPLPAEILQHPQIEALTTLTNHLICYANDVISFPKEAANGNVHNLVVIVQHEHQLMLDDSIDYVIELHNSEVAKFLNMCDMLPSFGNHNCVVNEYVQGLQWWLRANIDWSQTTTRYS